MNIGKWLSARLAEPSTHASLTGGLLVASQVFPQYAPILQAAAGVTAGMGIGLPESGKGGAGAALPTLPAAWIPPVYIQSNPHLAEAINVGLQAAINKLLEQPKTQ